MEIGRKLGFLLVVTRYRKQDTRRGSVSFSTYIEIERPKNRGSSCEEFSA